MTTKIDEHLQIADGQIECRTCGEAICDAHEEYIHHLPRASKPLSEANPLVVDPSHFVDQDVRMWDFYCPGCMTLLESQMLLEGREPFVDKQVDAKE